MSIFRASLGAFVPSCLRNGNREASAPEARQPNNAGAPEAPTTSSSSAAPSGARATAEKGIRFRMLGGGGKEKANNQNPPTIRIDRRHDPDYQMKLAQLRARPTQQPSNATEKNEQNEAGFPSSPGKSLRTQQFKSAKSKMAKVLRNNLSAFCIKLPPRQEIQLGLENLKEHFETLKAENWSPDKREFYGDVALLPIAVKAENARKPELNLHNFNAFQSFADALESGKLQNGRALFPLPVHKTHVVAADIRTIGDKISILVLEPISVKKEDVRGAYSLVLGPAMAEKLPANAKLTVLSIDAQKSNIDCRIFALSTASKMAKESEFFDEIHQENLSGQLDAVNIEAPEIETHQFDEDSPNNEPLGNGRADSTLSTEIGATDPSEQPAKVQVIDAHRLVPASFQKHTQAKSSLKEWGDEDSLAHTVVNKQGDTLLSRFDKHAVARYKRDAKKEGGPEENRLQRRTFNASIEEKRLAYLDHAIAYLDNAPPEEMSDLLSDFNSTMNLHKKRNKQMASIEREMGPER